MYNSSIVTCSVGSHSAVGKRLDLVTSSVQVEGSILTAGKRLSLKNLNVIIRAIN